MDAYLRAANESAARALMAAGNFRGAEARLRTMLAQNPNDARALALLAHCRFKENKGKQGLELARNAAAIDPDDDLVRSTLSYALLDGKSRKGRKEAEQLAEDIARDDPENPDALFALAVARFKNKDYGGAKLLFEDAEKFAGHNVSALMNVARLRLNEWNYAAAEELARRVMALDPTEGEVFRILGECALARRQPLEAYELALEALRLEPGEKKTMRLLTRARARSNRLLRPFLPGIDWIVEMDRTGLVVVPLLLSVLGGSAWVSVAYDLARMSAGEAPAVVVSVGLVGLLLYAALSYLTAASARIRIRRDLRAIALPRF